MKPNLKDKETTEERTMTLKEPMVEPNKTDVRALKTEDKLQIRTRIRSKTPNKRMVKRRESLQMRDLIIVPT